MTFQPGPPRVRRGKRSRARDQELVLVRKPVAPVEGAVGGKAVHDPSSGRTRAQARERREPRDGEHRAAERLGVRVLERPGRVELALWSEAALVGEGS